MTYIYRPNLYRPNLPSQFSPKYPSGHTHFPSKQEPPFLQEFKVHVYSKDGKTTNKTSVILIFFYQIIPPKKQLSIKSARTQNKWYTHWL